MRRSLRKGATILAVLALLPATVLAVTSTPIRGTGHILGSIGALDTSLPPDVLARASHSGLFAAFTWDGVQAKGNFVQFAYGPQPGVVSQFWALQGPNTTALLGSVLISPFFTGQLPVVAGPTFRVAAAGVALTAHDDPTALLECRTFGVAHTVTIRFLGPITDVLSVTRSPTWPSAGISFTIGSSNARILLAAGTLNVSDNVVTANLTASDLLVFKTVPSSAPDRSQRDALLEAFGSGRIVAEFSLVAAAGGGWAESSARYRLDLSAVPSAVEANDASVLIASMRGIGGLLILGFDPATMPADASHRIIVTADGKEIVQVDGGLATLIASSAAAGRASYTRLAMDATVLAVYLPGIATVTIRVSSAPLPPPRIDFGAAFGIFAALIVVAYAAMRMFRRPFD
jgi:hypothetical protein